MQSIDPTLLPICTMDMPRSATPDGCFTRNCANVVQGELLSSNTWRKNTEM